MFLFDDAMTKPNIIYTYDGSLKGFYCCVHEYILTREFPVDIVSDNSMQLPIYENKIICTDCKVAKSIRLSLIKKISITAISAIETVFLSKVEEKEIKMLKFIIKGCVHGKKIVNMFADPDVSFILKTQRNVLGERHAFLGFLRFSDYNGTLVATISPNNYILPLLISHFKDRYHNENFVIFDKTNKVMLAYTNHVAKILPADNIEFSSPSEKEKFYRSMWRNFYDTIGIEGRDNPKLRMNNMPKKYWDNMTEFQDD